jgi:hypothetical protein
VDHACIRNITTLPLAAADRALADCAGRHVRGKLVVLL